MLPPELARCFFCDPTRFEATMMAGGKRAGKIIQCLTMFKQKNEDVFREALEDPTKESLSNYWWVHSCVAAHPV